MQQYGSDSLRYWEVTSFIDTSSVDSTDYFMLVNRITCPDSVNNDPARWTVANPRAVSVVFTRPVGYRPIIENIFTNKICFLETADSTAQSKTWWTYTDTVDAGDGEIFRVTDVFTGPISGYVTLDRNIILTEDLVIDSGAVLTIEPGVTIYAYPHLDEYNQGLSDSTIEIICRGKINATGTASDSIRFVPWVLANSFPAPGDWQGIYLYEYSDKSRFEYCSILYGDIGLEMRSSADAQVSRCNISRHANSGIYNYKGYLDLTSSRIDHNGIYGVHSYMSSDSLYGSHFQDNGSYGIYLDTPLGTDSCYVLNDTITNPNSPSNQAGIYLRNRDKVRVSKCRVSNYETALGLYNSDAKISNNEFSNNGSYGVYAEYYSRPIIRQCTISQQLTGVRTYYQSSPNIGISPDSGLCSIINCTSYFIYHNYAAGAIRDTLKAQYNYYGSSPSPLKFYAVSPGFVLWLPKLSSAPPAPRLDPMPRIPLLFSLEQNYPNPLNPRTTIAFMLDAPGQTVITIYNLLGQKVTTLTDEMLPAGPHSIIWDGANENGEAVSSGIYFYTIQSGEHFQSKKMTLLR